MYSEPDVYLWEWQGCMSRLQHRFTNLLPVGLGRLQSIL